MKILLAVHHFPPRYFGGSEQIVAALAKNLIAAGHDIRVVCVETVHWGRGISVSHTEDVYEGVRVVRLGLEVPGGDARFHASYDHPGIGEWFSAHLAAEPADLVHLHGGYLLSISSMRAAAQTAPLIVTLHDYWFLCPRISLLRATGEVCDVPEHARDCAWCLALERRRFRYPAMISGGLHRKVGPRVADSPLLARRLGIHPDGESMRWRREALRGALALADVVVSPTAFLQAKFRDFVPAASLRLIRPGVDAGPSPSDPCRGEEGRPLRVSYIGQLLPQKGVHLLITAFRQLRRQGRQATLTIHGKVDALPAYARMLRRLASGDESIVFAGAFDHAELGGKLSASDVVVAPSVWYENGSQTVREALAAGVPVVASRIGALPELVEDGVDGLLCAPGDVSSLRDCLLRFFDRPDLLADLRRTLRGPVSATAEFERVLAMYERTVERARAPRRSDS